MQKKTDRYLEMKIHRRRSSSFLIFILFLLVFAGCQPGTADPAATQAAHFMPPTSDPALPAVSAPDPTALPTRQPNCDNQLEFLEDFTIPDGTEVLPGDKIVKRWLIRNDGSCNWTRSYTVQLISGLALGTDKIEGLFPARQYTEAVIEIIFNAPDNPGRYNSWWQAYDPDGNRFGDPFYIEISVVEEIAEVVPPQEELIIEETPTEN